MMPKEPVKPGPAETYREEGYFSARLPETPSRGKLWRVLCEYLQRDIPRDGSVLELGGGYCHFINHIHAAEKHVVDVYEGIRTAAAPGVMTYVQSCCHLDQFGSSSLDTVFASNLFEHLTREELLQTLSEVRRVLRPGGKLITVQPNFKYAYRDYFDDYTHVQIFTHVSLRDLLLSAGFAVDRVVPRFLPFSCNSAGPKWPWLLRLYLVLPCRPFAGQMYFVARKSS
jgi:SAM-dependent methyltransferase